MSQAPLQSSDDDEINLAVQFQGLRISVSGPSARALDFIHRLSPQYPAAQAQPEPESADSAATSQTSAAPAATHSVQTECPPQYLALSRKLSAASVHSPEERVRRAWLAGQIARAELAGVRVEESVVAIDLSSGFWAVLQGRGIVEPKILRSHREFKELADSTTGPPFVGHGFPSETEARVYIAGAGRAPRH